MICPWDHRGVVRAGVEVVEGALRREQAALQQLKAVQEQVDLHKEMVCGRTVGTTLEPVNQPFSLYARYRTSGGADARQRTSNLQ